MAQTFYPITPVDVTPDDASTWDTCDVSAHIPEGATGVILHCVVNDWSPLNLGLRKTGSTDDRHPDIAAWLHCWAMVGVDDSRTFEAYIESVTLFDIYILLVGYTMSGVTFATNADDKSLGDTGSWEPIDCSTEAPSDTGLIFEVAATLKREFGLRKNGSSDNRHRDTNKHSCFGAVIGCDESQICEGYIEDTNVDFFLLGYITDGVTFNTNATDLSLGSVGSWLDLAALPDESPVMGIIEVAISAFNKYGLRENGSGEDIYWYADCHPWSILKCDASRIIEGKIPSTNLDFFLVGYATAVVVTEKESSDTGSGADAKASGNPLATLSKSDAGSGAEGTPTQAANLTGTETGSGIEALVALLAIFIASETGSGVDVVAELAQLTLKTGSDSGSGVESLVTRLLATSETGTGLESLLARLLHHTDSGLGSDTRLTLLAALARAEGGSGLGAFTGLTAALTTAEAGSGIDELLGREITLLDAGSGLDIAILYKAFFSTDSGAGFEALVSLLALTITSEVGSGSEHLRAKIMTSPAAGDMKLPAKKGKAGIPSKGVNL